MKPELKPYQPPKPLEEAPIPATSYPKTWVIFNYTLIPAWVGVLMACFFTLASINEAWNEWNLSSSLGSFFLFPMMAMLIYGLPALFTGMCVAALKLHRHFIDSLKAAAIGFAGGVLPLFLIGDIEISAIVMFGGLASVGSFIMAWRILPKATFEFNT